MLAGWTAFQVLHPEEAATWAAISLDVIDTTIDVEVEGAARVEGHERKLRQVILNLVKNAAEAAGTGGRVEVRIGETPGGGAEVAVSDTGPGLSEATRDRLFEPFFTTKPAGTGLGLAVSQGIVQAHGGTLDVESPPGRGARFTVRLPAAPGGS
jgi:signal transduction histidine kinase